MCHITTILYTLVWYMSDFKGNVNCVFTHRFFLATNLSKGTEGKFFPVESVPCPYSQYAQEWAEWGRSAPDWAWYSWPRRGRPRSPVISFAPAHLPKKLDQFIVFTYYLKLCIQLNFNFLSISKLHQCLFLHVIKCKKGLIKKIDFTYETYRESRVRVTAPHHLSHKLKWVVWKRKKVLID